MNNEADLSAPTQQPSPILVGVSSDVAQLAEFFEILISIDRRRRKEANYVEQENPRG